MLLGVTDTAGLYQPWSTIQALISGHAFVGVQQQELLLQCLSHALFAYTYPGAPYERKCLSMLLLWLLLKLLPSSTPDKAIETGNACC